MTKFISFPHALNVDAIHRRMEIGPRCSVPVLGGSYKINHTQTDEKADIAGPVGQGTSAYGKGKGGERKIVKITIYIRMACGSVGKLHFKTHS